MTNTSNTATKRKAPGQRASDEVVGINVTVPVALHRRLRVKALNEGLVLSEAIEAAIKAWLR